MKDRKFRGSFVEELEDGSERSIELYFQLLEGSVLARVTPVEGSEGSPEAFVLQGSQGTKVG